MSDFAKAQLQKYGWTEGKGLGKNENGIVEALKPKLKFDTTGIGHKELDLHWWNDVYNKALKNIVLDAKSDDISRNEAKESTFNINSNSSNIENSTKKQFYHGKFLKTSILQNGNTVKDSTCEINESVTKDKTDFTIISNEELFKACGGRTAHKGARHGLTLNGKLSRVAKQEEELLAKFLKSKSTANLDCNEIKQKKKKRRKKDQKLEDCNSIIKDTHISDDDEDHKKLNLFTQNEEECRIPKKTRKKVKQKIDNLTHQLTKSCMIQDDSIIDNNRKKSKTKVKVQEEVCEENSQKTKCKYKKKKCKRKWDHQDEDLNNLDNDVPMEPNHKKLRNYDTNLVEETSTIQESNEIFNCGHNLERVKIKRKCKNKKLHHSRDHKHNYCTKTEAKRLNDKIKLKKCKKLERKEKKKLEELSKSLFAVSLDLDSTIINSTDKWKKKKSQKDKVK